MIEVKEPLSTSSHSLKDSKPKALIIAAGRGIRLGSLTEECPKCLLKLEGKTLLDYQLEALRANGITDISIIKGHQAEKIDYPALKAYINKDYKNNNILCSLMTASEEMDSPFMASYSDIVYGSDVISALLKDTNHISLVVDMDWRKKYIGRTEHPESEAEKAIVNSDGRVLEVGKSINKTDGDIGEFIGLFKCSREGAKLLKDAFEYARYEFDGQVFYNARSLQSSYITDIINFLIDRGVEIHCVPIQGGWREIDTKQDLEEAQSWIKNRFEFKSANFLKMQGQRLLSELNDFKRTVASCAQELDWKEEELNQVLKGNTTLERMDALIEAMCSVYPINRFDLELSWDDTHEGVKIMKKEESKETSRVFDRRDKNANLTPYYEYRDTATSRLCLFRPEWIKELRVVENNDPKNPDVIYNNGHFMHQVTFFVGPVNFYYQIGEEKFCEEMNTGDFNYITPYFPHSFTSRDPNQEAYIVAVTFGGDVRRSLDELYRMGKNRALQYVFNSRNIQKGTQELLDYHLKNEWLSRELFQERLNENACHINVLDSEKLFNQEELEQLAGYLNIEPSELQVPEYRPEEDVVVQKKSETKPFNYPDNTNPRYKIWSGSRSRRIPLVKTFNLQVLAEEKVEQPDLNYGLHSYLYNYSQGAAVLRWKGDGKINEDILEPGDSACIQPFVPFELHKANSLMETQLCVVGIPGSVNLSVQREMSSYANFDRVVSEDKCWFSI